MPAARPLPYAAAAAYPLPPGAGRRVDLIVVHCSATPSGQALGTVTRSAADVIDQWHRERGFARQGRWRDLWNPQLGCIGYHFVIDTDGQICTGRRLDEIGAHVAGHNASSIGICMVGGVEPRARYTPEQWASLAMIVQDLLPLCARGARLVGHRDLSPDTDGDGRVEPREWLKTCPGFDVAAWQSNHYMPLEPHVLRTGG